jgi:tetratricopeptide (TPR) repeat protein
MLSRNQLGSYLTKTDCALGYENRFDMNIRLGKIFLLFFLLSGFLQTRGQVVFTSPDGPSDIATAMTLFEKEKYAAAIRVFDGIIGDQANIGTLDRSEAAYWGAIASMRLFHPDAEYRMNTFIGSNPESPRINQAWLDLGEFFYQAKNYRKAVDAYDNVHRLELEPAKLSAFFFKFGYSLMMRGDRPSHTLPMKTLSIRQRWMGS